MAHNTTINATSGGDSIVDYDLAAGGAYPTTGKVAASVIYHSPDGATPPTPLTPAHPLPVAVASLPIPAGAATEAGNLATIAGKDFATQTTLAALASAAATAANQSALATLTGAVTETAPATDTASSGLNGRLQRIAQRLTSLLALLPGSLGQKTAANSLAVVVASDQSALTVAPVRGTLTDRSGTITAGGTSQQVCGTNSTRSTFLLQNLSTGDLWINFTTAAVASQPSIKVASGSTFSMDQGFVSTEAVNVIGATTNAAYVAKEG